MWFMINIPILMWPSLFTIQILPFFPSKCGFRPPISPKLPESKVQITLPMTLADKSCRRNKCPMNFMLPRIRSWKRNSPSSQAAKHGDGFGDFLVFDDCFVVVFFFFFRFGEFVCRLWKKSSKKGINQNFEEYKWWVITRMEKLHCFYIDDMILYMSLIKKMGITQYSEYL